MSQEDHTNGGLKGAVNKMQDMVGGAVGLASASTAGSHDSQAFVTNAAMGDLYEVEAGRLARRRGRTEDIRAFGEMMVEHHTTSTHQLRSALASSETAKVLPDPQPPPTLDERRQGLLDHLAQASDDAFDRLFVDQQRMAHRETATLLEGYAEHGDNAQLRSVALGALPMVRRHQAMLERLGRH